MHKQRGLWICSHHLLHPGYVIRMSVSEKNMRYFGSIQMFLQIIHFFVCVHCRVDNGGLFRHVTNEGIQVACQGTARFTSNLVPSTLYRRSFGQIFYHCCFVIDVYAEPFRWRKKRKPTEQRRSEGAYHCLPQGHTDDADDANRQSKIVHHMWASQKPSSISSSRGSPQNGNHKKEQRDEQHPRRMSASISFDGHSSNNQSGFLQNIRTTPPNR